MAGRIGSPAGSRLFGYDLKIAVNSLRTTFARWRDRVSAVATLALALLFVRSWLAGQAWGIAAATILGIGFAAGVLAGRSIAARVAFHSSDGVLAADALRAGMRWRYIAGWHLAGLAVSLAATLVIGAALSGEAVAGYLGGALCGHLTAGVAWQRVLKGGRRFGLLRSWLRRPGAGLAGAFVLLLSLSLAVRSVGREDLAIIAGLETGAIALALTALENGVIRFMALTGRSPPAIVRHHARGTLLFLGIGAPACLIGFGPAPAAAVLVVSAAALLLMVLRILAYQVSTKRVADLLVSLLAAILIATAFYAPVLLPFLLVATLWRLGRRAAGMTWLVA